MNPRAWLRMIILAVFACGGALAPQIASAAGPAAAEVAPRARAATPTETRNYAEREEKAAPELKQFEGGRLVIVMSTLGAVLLGVLLLVILL